MRWQWSLVLFVFPGLLAPAFPEEIRGRLELEEGTPKDEIAVWLEGIDSDLPIPEDTPELSQRGAEFTPHMLVISVGQSVDMPNDDDIAHNVFSYSEPRNFNLGIYPRGESRTVHFETPGLVEIYCSIHRQMSALIYVVPSPLRTRTDEQGAFALKDVPPGTYSLKIWGKSLGIHEYEVEVQPETVAELLLEPRPKD